MKLCKDCKHYSPPNEWVNKRGYTCERPLWGEDEVRGLHSIKHGGLCSYQRLSPDDHRACGPEARFYEPSIWKRIKDLFMSTPTTPKEPS